MMVDFALVLERKGMCTGSASADLGSMCRFRPIIIITACAIIGTLPIAIGIGADADSRRSLGLCLVGGLLFGQLLSLYVTPVFYTYMDSFLKWRRRSKRQEEPEAVGAPLLATDAERLAQH